MQMASMDLAFRRAALALTRFPLAVAASLLGMGAALRFNHLPLGEAAARDIALNLLLASWLGVGLFVSLAIFAESRKWRSPYAWGLQALALALLAVYYWSLPQSPYPERITRFWLLMGSVHLLALLAPALGRGISVPGIWHFNQRLGARLGLAAGYSVLLYLGMIVALAAVKQLFEVPIPDAWFLDPGIAILGGFFTWFFLAGVPAPPTSLAAAEEAEVRPYPRQMRILAQFILLPLVSLYLVILYAYAAKVLIGWEWPTGWASYLILALFGFGLFTVALLKPLEEKGNRWVVFYARHFHHAMIPLLILLFAAIGRRVYEYGLTEKRYCVLALAVWLTGVTLHSVLDRRRDIRVLPASLGLVWLMAAFGPWGAFEVSRKSQIARLQGILEANGMLVGGKLAKSPGNVTRRDNLEISAIAQYLEERDRLKDLEPWIPAPDSAQAQSAFWSRALDSKFAFVEALELPYLAGVKRGPGDAETVSFSCRSCSGPVKRVSGYDFLYVDYRSDRESEGFRPDGRDPEGLRFAFDPSEGVLRFTARDSIGPALDLTAHFTRLRDRYPEAYELNLPEEEMFLEQEDKQLKVGLRLRSLKGEALPDTLRLRAFAADVFVKIKGRGGRLR